MKIAVVGGGIAGLAVAWLLSRHHEVTLFERHTQPGFVAHSVAVDGVRVDVPLRVFYPEIGRASCRERVCYVV